MSPRSIRSPRRPTRCRASGPAFARSSPRRGSPPSRICCGWCRAATTTCATRSRSPRSWRWPRASASTFVAKVTSCAHGVRARPALGGGPRMAVRHGRARIAGAGGATARRAAGSTCSPGIEKRMPAGLPGRAVGRRAQARRAARAREPGHPRRSTTRDGWRRGEAASRCRRSSRAIPMSPACRRVALRSACATACARVGGGAETACRASVERAAGLPSLGETLARLHSPPPDISRRRARGDEPRRQRVAAPARVRRAVRARRRGRAAPRASAARRGGAVPADARARRGARARAAVRADRRAARARSTSSAAISRAPCR